MQGHQLRCSYWAKPSRGSPKIETFKMLQPWATTFTRRHLQTHLRSEKKGESSAPRCNGRGHEVEQNVSLWKPGKRSLRLTAKFTTALLFCTPTPLSLFTTTAVDYKTHTRMWCWFWNCNASPCFLLADQISFYYRIIVIPACRFVLFIRQSRSYILKNLTIYLGVLTSI